MKTRLEKLYEHIDHPIITTLKSIRSDYLKNRFTFIPGNIMKDILFFFGATDEDLKQLEYSGNFLGEDPTLPFRESRNGRFLIDFEQSTISRLKFQPFILSKDEDFNRDDSGIFRNFRGIQDDIQCNKAFQGLIKFQALIFENIEIKGRKNLDNNWSKWVSTIFQLRTITTPKTVAEPAKEGVHSDGVEHTMTTLLFAKNMTKDSAITQIHNSNQKTGIHHNDSINEFIVGKYQHKHFLDTILIVDSEHKHSLSSVEAFDTSEKALRDMIILFTRRPKSKSHSTYNNDSLNLHQEIPLKFKIT